MPSKSPTERAVSAAACGGQTEGAKSLRAASSEAVPASTRPAADARSRVDSLRPADAQSTSTPRRRNTAPIAAPISPGCRRPTTSPMTDTEVSVTNLDTGVQRLTLPLPTGPRHVHCYMVDGTLFDTGLGLEAPNWRELGIERIAITHFHPDHVGGAEGAASESGAPVSQGALDYAQCERVWGSNDWPERIADWFLTHGVPEAISHDLIEAGHAFASFVRFAREPELLYEGSELDGWRVLELPGHADGHIGFER